MAKKKINTKLIVAGAVFVVGLVMMLIVLLSPVSKIGVYKNKEELSNGQEIVTEYKFGKDKYTVTINDKGDEEGVAYDVKEGKLYTAGVLPLGEINSRVYKIGDGDNALVYKNGLTSALFIVSIVLTAAGALGAGAVVVLGKKKK